MADESVPRKDPRLGNRHDCYAATDPRTNKELSQSLKGQNVLVTGAGRGVGRAIAQFLTHASAATLTIVALEQAEVDETAALCREINPALKTKAVALNVTDAVAVEKLFKEVESDFGVLDVVVCNAGRPPQWLSVVDSEPNIWWDTVAVSLQHAFLFTHYALPAVQARTDGRRGARFIYTSSSGAQGNRGMSSYVLGKLGQVRLAEIVHAENFEDHGVKAFAYNPGAIKTRFYTDFEDRVEGRAARAGTYVEEDAPNQDKSAALAVKLLSSQGNWDTPELAAGLVTVLASGKLDFMSGRFADASVDVEEYIKNEKQIREEDLHRVRLHLDKGKLIPRLDF